MRDSAKGTRNSIDLAHSNFLIQIIELLEHNDFLTSQSQRTKDMDDFAEIGECVYFDEAYVRLTKLQEIGLANVDVNMFKAINNQLINDGCGLFRGRQILPFEHLSRFQNDLID